MIGWILLGLLGCVAPAPAPLRVGINAWPGYEFLHLAVEKGYLREEGVEVQIVEFSALADTRRAFERGQIDVLGTTLVEALQACDSGARVPQVVRVIDASEGADVILLRKDRPEGASGMRGARVGVELASLGVYILHRGLEVHGLSMGDVKAEGMDPLSMVEAFQRGEIDAAVMYPPASLQLQAEARVWFSTAEIPGEVVDVLAVDQALAAQRPAEVRGLIRGFVRAVEDMRREPPDTYARIAARENTTPAEIQAMFTEGMKVLADAPQGPYLQAGGSLVPVLQRTDAALRAQGQVKGRDCTSLILSDAFLSAY